MYPNPYNQQAYVYSTPVQHVDYHYITHDERQFGGFQPPFGPPGQGGGFQPPFGQPGQGGGFQPPFGQPGQGGGFQPPFGPPGQGPSGQPGQGGPTSGPPTSPPPSYVPQQQATAFAVDPGGIRRCLFRFTYIWLRGNEQFWFFPIFVGRNSVSGYRWTGFRWMYFGISLRQIQSFTCV
ncbi:hypothetical protein QFZ87_000674 [Bacillus sp. SLBN-46]|uniref:hypothetical protein n=1 Tax=Bacillus sp. SLBN-46 TaxID=3042283 RepID=UPI00285B6D48|nr:hypothetical protein [Bacillus sp. SLBN-46]MDR6121077.1 hypothetical protein [Bacillus sp. SLBN-46]